MQKSHISTSYKLIPKEELRNWIGRKIYVRIARTREENNTAKHGWLIQDKSTFWVPDRTPCILIEAQPNQIRIKFIEGQVTDLDQKYKSGAEIYLYMNYTFPDITECYELVEEHHQISRIGSIE